MTQNNAPVVWRPISQTQYDALMCPAKHVLFQGNRGGGKSDCLLISYLQEVGKGYGSDYVGIIFRISFPELSDIIRRSQQLFPLIYPTAKYNKSAHMWEFPGGELLYFRFADGDDAWRTIHGWSVSFLGMEECSQWPNYSILQKIITTMRTKIPQLETRVRYTTNPSGIGAAWVKENFIDKAMSGEIFEFKGQTAAHFFMDLKENSILMKNDPSYIKSLENLDGPLRAAWYEGSWEFIVDGMFSCFNREFNVIKRSGIDLKNRGWRITRGFDWGYSAPFAVIWCAEALYPMEVETYHGTRTLPKGSVVMFSEYYGWNGEPNKGIRMLDTEIAREIIEKEEAMGIRQLTRPGCADSSIFDVINGKSIGDSMAQMGVQFEKAAKGKGSRIAGWSMMRSMFSAATKPVIEEPCLLFTDNCEQAIRTIPSLPRDPKKQDDVDTAAEDHLGDALRYNILKPDTKKFKIGKFTH